MHIMLLFLLLWELVMIKETYVLHLFLLLKFIGYLGLLSKYSTHFLFASIATICPWAPTITLLNPVKIYMHIWKVIRVTYYAFYLLFLKGSLPWSEDWLIDLKWHRDGIICTTLLGGCILTRTSFVIFKSIVRHNYCRNPKSYWSKT